MSTLTLSRAYSIHEVTPAEFAPLCWEAHPATQTELATYLRGTIDHEHRGALFVAYDSAGKYAGRVAVEVHSGYNSRGRPCATFGWCDGQDAKVIAEVLHAASEWATRQEITINGRPKRNALLRGPISFPKHLGGAGCQVEGFQQPRMITVPANRPELGEWIAAAGFKADAPYACVDVTETPTWPSAPGELDGFQLVTLSAAEWRERREEVVALGAAAFGDFLPDTVGGRFPSMHALTAAWSDPFYSWPAALDSAGHLAGVIIALPNAWDQWNHHSVSGLDVDTVIVAPQYRGKGLFSAIHNKGVADTKARCGIRYYEGTSIWMANENAVKSIFPHGVICRRHVVFQQRLKKESLSPA